MGDKIQAVTGDYLIYSKINENTEKEIQQEEVNSIIDEIRGESQTLDKEELYNALLENYDILDEQALLDTINQVASTDGYDKTISKDDFNKVFEIGKTQEPDTVLDEASISTETVAATNKTTSTTEVSDVAEVTETGYTGFTTEALYKMNGQQFCSSMDPEVRSQLIDYLEFEVAEIQEGLDDTKNHNGIISGLWDGFKNLTGIGASSNKAQNKIDTLKYELAKAKDDPEQLATVYKNITGKDLTAEEFDKICTGESSLKTDTEAAQSVSKYQDGQRMVTDVVADVAVGFAAVGAVAAVAAAPFTGGATLGLLPSCLIGLGAGAVTKPAVKFLDAKTGGREYNAKDLAYDAVTGGVGGAMSVAGARLGNVLSTGIGKAAKLPMLEKVISTKIGGAAFNFASRSATRYTVGFASGAADAVARDVVTGNTDNLLGDALKQGNAAGLTSVVIGGVSDAAHAGINKVRGKNAASATGAAPDDIKGTDNIESPKVDADIEAHAAKTYTADDLAQAQSKVNDLYNEALKYGGDELPESLQKEYTAAVNELNNIKQSITYTPDDLAQAQAKVDNLYNEALRYDGEEIPESLQQDFAAATEELNTIQKSMAPVQEAPEIKQGISNETANPKRALSEIEDDIKNTQEQLRQAQKIDRANRQKGSGKSKEAIAKGETNVQNLEKKLEELQAEALNSSEAT